MNKNYLKDFVPYEQALALKELGFNEPCMAIYYSKDKSFSWHHHVDHTNDEPILDSGEFNISAPLKQQVFRWFREKHGLCSWIEKMYTADSICYHRYTCEYKKDPSSKTHEVILSIKEYNTYEEAELACLRKLIEIVKQQL